MVTICILVGLGLAACGVIIACVTTNGSKEKSTNAPPPLPPRVNVDIPSPTVSHAQTRTCSYSTARALPPRRSSASAVANAARRTAGVGYGPRGIKSTQFPCCPIDKLRNIPGEGQVIFWNSGENCYHCSRGHLFKNNGKLL